MLFNSILSNEHHVLHKLLPNTTYHTYSLRNRRHKYTLSNKTDTDERNYPPFASIAKGEVFVLLYVFFCLFVFLFVRSTISQQPGGRFTPYFACGRSQGRDVSSPLLGVGGPRRAEKEANEFSVTMESMGNFLHFGGF